MQKSPQGKADHQDAGPVGEHGDGKRVRKRGDGQADCVETDGYQERQEAEDVQCPEGTTRRLERATGTRPVPRIAVCRGLHVGGVGLMVVSNSRTTFGTVRSVVSKLCTTPLAVVRHATALGEDAGRLGGRNSIPKSHNSLV